MSFEAAVRYEGDIAILDLTGRIVLNDGSATMREAIAKLREAVHQNSPELGRRQFHGQLGSGRARQRLFLPPTKPAVN